MSLGTIKFVEIAPEDHKIIENLYNQIIRKYIGIIKSGNGNGSSKIERVPTFKDALKFLIEHSMFNEKDMDNFVICFTRSQETIEIGLEKNLCNNDGNNRNIKKTVK